MPLTLTANIRDSARSYGESDPIDALALARAAQREPNLTTARLDGHPAARGATGWGEGGGAALAGVGGAPPVASEIDIATAPALAETLRCRVQAAELGRV